MPEYTVSDLDEEFQRAQEMALAVATLGSNVTKTNNADKIRKKVEKAMKKQYPEYQHNQKVVKRSQSFDSPKRGLRPRAASRSFDGNTVPLPAMSGTSSTSTKADDSQPQSTTKIPSSNINATTEQGITPTSEPIIISSVVALITSLLKKIPGNLYGVVGIANFCIFYLSCTPPSFLHFFTAIMLFNTTIYLTILQEAEISGIEQVRVEEEEEAIQIQLPTSDSTDQPQIRLEWLADVTFPETDLQDLYNLQPDSTLAERRRFLKARKGSVKAASAQLGNYLDWRNEKRLSEFFSQPKHFSSDADDWAAAARGALELAGGNSGTTELPRLVSILPDNVQSKLGARLVHVLPCQLDSRHASHQTYALAVGMYLDRQLSREHTEKVTVVIDIRAGTGWSNPSAVSIVPFLKVVVGLLNSHFPERLSKCILFPLPRAASMLFNTAKSYLDPDTASKIQVCSGSGAVTSPVPDKVATFLGPSVIRSLEERRLSFFNY